MPTLTMKQLQQEQVLAEMIAEKLTIILGLTQEIAILQRQNENLKKQLEALHDDPGA